MAKRTPPTHPRHQGLLQDLGGRLRAARMRRSMSQAELALRVGVSAPTLGKLENGDATTSLATVVRVMAVLGMADDLALIAKHDVLGRQLQDRALRPTTGRKGSKRESA